MAPTKMLLFGVGVYCVLTPVSYAQPGAKMAVCRALDNGNSPAGFVVALDTRTTLSATYPTPVTNDANPAFRVCIPVDLTRQEPIGAVNIKIQVYTSFKPDEMSRRQAEYESRLHKADIVQYHRDHGRDAYPSLGISDYQNYHGCTDVPNVALETSFHGYVEYRNTRRATNDLRWRNKFVFSQDVPARCTARGQFVAFFENLPSIGPTVAWAAGEYNATVEKITRRRSVLLNYNFAGTPTGVHYVTYDLPPVGTGKYIRIEASHIFDETSRPTVIGLTKVAN